MPAEFAGVRQAATLVNLGPGGFAVATTEWLPSMAWPSVRFRMPDRRWSPTFEVRMSFALLKPRKTGPHAGRFVTGFAFRDANVPAVKRQVQELMDQLLGVTA